MVAGLDSGFVCVCHGSVLRTLPPHTVAAMTKHCTSLQVRTRPSPYSCLMLDSLRCDLLCVSFHAAPSSRTQKQKAIKSDPGGKTLRFVGGALPHSGSESGLMALNACLVSTPCASSIPNKCHGVSRPHWISLELLPGRSPSGVPVPAERVLQKRHRVAFGRGENVYTLHRRMRTLRRRGWCPRSGLNRRPPAYKADALPLSYKGWLRANESDVARSGV